MQDNPQLPLQNTESAAQASAPKSEPKPSNQNNHIKVFAIIGSLALIFAIISYYMAWSTYKETPLKITVADQQAISSIINTIEPEASASTPESPLKNLQNISGTEVISPESLAIATTPSSATIDPTLPAIIEEDPEPELVVKLSKKNKNMPKYELNAELVVGIPEGAPRIALIFDDLGVLGKNSLRVIEELPKEITLSFLPYGKHTKDYAVKARNFHHEVMIHLPMEAQTRPDGKIINPGEGALYTKDDLNQIRNKIVKNYEFLSKIAVGVNNHMGSKFTMWQAGMEETLKVTANQKLMFLDSVTTNKSVVKKAHKSLNLTIPLLKRDVFIDHVQEKEAILKYLTNLEKVAIKNGSAIGIGHPHNITIEVIKEWLPTLQEKGIYLVPITNLIRE